MCKHMHNVVEMFFFSFFYSSSLEACLRTVCVRPILSFVQSQCHLTRRQLVDWSIGGHTTAMARKTFATRDDGRHRRENRQKKNKEKRKWHTLQTSNAFNVISFFFLLSYRLSLAGIYYFTEAFGRTLCVNCMRNWLHFKWKKCRKMM